MNIKITREYIENSISTNTPIEIAGREVCNINLSNLHLKYENLSNTKFISVNLQRCNLDETDISNALFINSDLSFATIKNAKAINAKFINCSIEGCNFSNSNLDKTLFCGSTDQHLNTECDINLKTSLTNTTFKSAHIDDARFTHIELNSNNFREAHLNNTEFINCLLENVEFISASLVGSTLTDCRVIDCNFSQAKCVFTMFDSIPGLRNNFAYANLNHALFKNINMPDTNFQFTTGANTRFETAGIKNANFEYSELKATIFKNTNLTGIKLGNKHFEQMWGKDSISATIDIAECVNKDSSIKLTLNNGLHKPHNYTDKIEPNNTFTDEYYGFYISKLNAEHMVKAYKSINGTDKIEDWSVADIMVDCLDIQEVNFVTYSEIFIDFINDITRLECDGFIIQATKDKTTINEDELIKACKTHYGNYLPDDFDYKNNIVLFRCRYCI